MTTLVAALLLAGAGSAYAYVRSQFYVGADTDEVAIFRGVAGSVAGIAFHSVEQRTGLTTDRLDPLALRQVERGIVADGAAAAVATPAPVSTPVPTPSPSCPAGTS